MQLEKGNSPKDRDHARHPGDPRQKHKEAVSHITLPLHHGLDKKMTNFVFKQRADDYIPCQREGLRAEGEYIDPIYRFMFLLCHANYHK